METLLIPILIALGIVIVVFLILRELVLWYFKINTIIENQKVANDLLKKTYILHGGKIETITPLSIDQLKDNDIVFVEHKVTGETAEWTFAKWKAYDYNNYDNLWMITKVKHVD
jgi:hypothetical protein